jgi:hypothetical protein
MNAVLVFVSVLVACAVSFGVPLFLSGLVFAQNSTIGGNATTESFVTYGNPKYPFYFQYPQNWLVKEQSNSVWFTSPVDLSGNVRIDCDPVSNQSLSKLVEIQLDELAHSFKDFKIINSNPATLGGIAANLTHYSYAMEEHILFSTNMVKFNAMLMSALHNDNFCTVLYFSTPEFFDIYLPIVNRMIGSLTWIV